MTITLRVILIIASVLSFILCIRRVKQSKLQITDSIIWIIGSFLLILMSIFSNLVEWLSVKLGFLTPVNFVFISIIGFLLIETFITNIKISILNDKIKNLSHHIAFNEYHKNQKSNIGEGENNIE